MDPFTLYVFVFHIRPVDAPMNKCSKDATSLGIRWIANIFLKWYLGQPVNSYTWRHINFLRQPIIKKSHLFMRDFRQNRIQSKLNYSVKPYIYVILIAQKKQRTNICLIFFAFTTFFRTAFTPQKRHLKSFSLVVDKPARKTSAMRRAAFSSWPGLLNGAGGFLEHIRCDMSTKMPNIKIKVSKFVQFLLPTLKKLNISIFDCTLTSFKSRTRNSKQLNIVFEFESISRRIKSSRLHQINKSPLNINDWKMTFPFGAKLAYFQGLTCC